MNEWPTRLFARNKHACISKKKNAATWPNWRKKAIIFCKETPRDKWFPINIIYLLWQLVSWFIWCFHVSWVVALVFCTPFVCMSYTSPCSVNWNGWACGPVARVTIWRSRDWVVSWSAVGAWSPEGCWTWKRARRSITTVCWNSFYGLVVKTVGKYTVYTIWTLKSELWW